MKAVITSEHPVNEMRLLIRNYPEDDYKFDLILCLLYLKIKRKCDLNEN